MGQGSGIFRNTNDARGLFGPMRPRHCTRTCTLLKVHKKNMLFEYTRRRGVRSPVTDAATFKVGHLKQTMAHEAETVDLSHLIDTSYNYHSPRELRWHLAERFGMAPEAIALREHH